MAPSNQRVVTLKLPGEQLQALDFSGCAVLDVKKPKKRGGARPRPKKEDTGAGPGGAAGAAGTAPSGVVIGPTNNVDPVLGSLPRSLRAAPVANTSGLVIDKTPCRKWQRRPLQIRTFAGYTCDLWGWTSDYTPAEWTEQQKRDAQEQAKEEQYRTELAAQREEAARQEQAKQEAVRQEQARKEAVRAEASNAKAAKRAAKKEERATKTRKPPAKRPSIKLKLDSEIPSSEP